MLLKWSIIKVIVPRKIPKSNSRFNKSYTSIQIQLDYSVLFTEYLLNKLTWKLPEFTDPGF